MTASAGTDEQLVTPPQANKNIQSEEVDVELLAFNPDRWKEAGADFSMLAWPGRNVVLLTKKGEYDATAITGFVERLDQGWDVYRDIVGMSPPLRKNLNGKPTICALPQPHLSCGYGCGFIGDTGIEVAGFYLTDWPNFLKQPDGFAHYYFYEMGRNYFVFGDRHSLFTTGFAVFMRYVCMDRLQCVDDDFKTRQSIESLEDIYMNSNVSFFDAFTCLGQCEKENRLKDTNGCEIAPSDHPCMYATAMLKLRNDYGGDSWVRKFCRRMLQCKPHPATCIDDAKPQCFNWLVCASAAAGKALTPVFADRWRMPMTDSERDVMKKTNWTDEQLLSVSTTVDELLDADQPPTGGNLRGSKIQAESE